MAGRVGTARGDRSDGRRPVQAVRGHRRLVEPLPRMVGETLWRLANLILVRIPERESFHEPPAKEDNIDAGATVVAGRRCHGAIELWCELARQEDRSENPNRRPR